MNNEKTVNSTIKDSTVKATPKKKKMKETSEIPLKHGKLLTAIMTIVTLVYVSPIFIVLMNSFKANTFVKTDTFAWPTGEALVGWANYIKGFTFGNYPFFKSVLYSFVITVLSTALILICTSMAAWYIARVDSIVCKIVYYLFVFSMVVLYDACGVRYETGKQAHVLNEIMTNPDSELSKMTFNVKLEELVGHTPFQVFVGAIVGLIIGLIF